MSPATARPAPRQAGRRRAAGRLARAALLGAAAPAWWPLATAAPPEQAAAARPAGDGSTRELVVATVNNPHMIELQRQSLRFEQAHPGCRLRWITLEEGLLRQRLAQEAAAGGASSFDVVTLGAPETLQWAASGWLSPFEPPADWDADDLLPMIRRVLTHEGRLYAVPFYGESSMLFARADLLARAGLRLPERPTWAQVRAAAARLHDPAHGVCGIGLRGKAGWGDNMALIHTMVHGHGGRFFDERGRPQLDSRPWREAVTLYLELLQRYGPPAPVSNNFNELLALFREGRCALWVDATIAGSALLDPQRSRVADRLSFHQAPYAVTPRGANWLWCWALAVPRTARQPALAQRFALWAGSRDYVAAVAQARGWSQVPTGTRRSTYDTPAFQAAAAYAPAERRALDAIRPDDPGLPQRPRPGAPVGALAQAQAIGIAVGQQISLALAGRIGVDEALQAGQRAAERELARAGAPS
ncbi:ABC transporter substrate-binding protein [Piscinibacter sakaiensis]|uniref:Various polyols ABC transporter, periplasmic substrate-binding protein n=1 Tax=Piscinibacter sakaiensis TaxID=1547922 RepID=A0A0K8P4S1_PISS1|nr:sugar ABC transporter substrate-binding protein [Piscinibacter sakaiensis]GAP37652.1 various polyols ABC transporter, periplasmic substrate-binding protein [Piscinibacter sakaiensis]